MGNEKNNRHNHDRHQPDHTEFSRANHDPRRSQRSSLGLHLALPGLGGGSMNYIKQVQQLEDKYGSMVNVPDDDPTLLWIRKQATESETGVHAVHRLYKSPLVAEKNRVQVQTWLNQGLGKVKICDRLGVHRCSFATTGANELYDFSHWDKKRRERRAPNGRAKAKKQPSR